MPLAQLISAAQLHERLDNPDLLLIDCRFALDDPQYGARQYANGHIPNAHFADLEADLSGPVVKGLTGRHPLPDPQQLSAKLRSWGLREHSRVVLYDDGNGAFAARAWWLLQWLGKSSNVYLLEGGFSAWQQAGFALSTEPPQEQQGDFQEQINPQLLISAEQLQQRLAQERLTLLDARALPRYLGEVEPLDPVAGHIPGALCASFNDNLNPQGGFLSSSKLRERFDALRGERPISSVVAYCGSGVTACHNLFAMCLAGYPLQPLYAGSWSEWITDPSRPIERGQPQLEA